MEKLFPGRSGPHPRRRPDDGLVGAGGFLFLALLCGLFYNAWAYEVDRVLREEGSWQARLTLTDAGQAETLEQFAQVDTVTPNGGLCRAGCLGGGADLPGQNRCV